MLCIAGTGNIVLRHSVRRILDAFRLKRRNSTPRFALLPENERERFLLPEWESNPHPSLLQSRAYATAPRQPQKINNTKSYSPS